MSKYYYWSILEQPRMTRYDIHTDIKTSWSYQRQIKQNEVQHHQEERDKNSTY